MANFCPSCKKFTDLKVGQDGFVDCPQCGRHEIPDHMYCRRCGFGCLHVEAGGIFGCPNCGDPMSTGDHKVIYSFNQGCGLCGLPGHMPKSGCMRPVPRGHPKIALGLAPCIDDMIEEVMDS